MSKIEQYLQSEEAARDVAAAIADDLAYLRSLHEGAWTTGDLWTPNQSDFSPWIQMRHMRACFSCEGQKGRHFLSVYFRPEGDRYVVSDLGEATRALRLRTGRVEIGNLHMDALTSGTGIRWTACDAIMAGDAQRSMSTPEGWSVPAADLPHAIVRVMFAAHRVASLDVRPHG